MSIPKRCRVCGKMAKEPECQECEYMPLRTQTEKKCLKCGRVRPLNEFYGYSRGNRDTYYSTYCKDCTRAYIKARNTKVARRHWKSYKRPDNEKATELLREQTLRKFNKEVKNAG